MKIANIILVCVLFFISCNSADKKVDRVLVRELWNQNHLSHKNYRIPSIIVSKANTLLAFAEGREGGDSGDIDILLKRSLDNGKTWSEQIMVWDDAGNTCGNPCPVINQETGRIILFMTWNLGSDHEVDIIRKTSDSPRLPYMTYSDDDGLTWSVPKDMSARCRDENWGWYATGPGVAIQMKNGAYKGRLVIPCNHSYDDPSKENQDQFVYGSHVLLSDDGGENWRKSQPISPNVNESQVVELNDGTLLMNMRSYNDKASRAIALSSDGGESWSNIYHDPQLVESVCQASIIDFGDDERGDMYLFSNPAAPISRTHMTIKMSWDDCETWPNSKLIYAGPSAYSCLSRLPNGHVGLFFETGETSPYEKIIFVSCEPSELISPGALLDTI